VISGAVVPLDLRRSSTAKALRSPRVVARAGYDPGKRIRRLKRQIMTDTNGLLLAVHILRHVFADRVHRGKQLNALPHCGPSQVLDQAPRHDLKLLLSHFESDSRERADSGARVSFA
jgi:hypothetical protein